MFDNYFKLMEYVFKLYQWQLINCDEAMDYILPRINGDRLLLEEFEIGLAGSYNELYTEVSHMFTEVPMLCELELLRERKGDKGGYYDVFRDRIIFPIRDEFGNPVGLGGRSIFHEEQQALKDKGEDVFVPAKYINSSSTKLFNKSEVVYNLYRAKEHIKDMGFVYLAEGYLDVMAIHASCRDDGKFRQNVVGTLGTALTYQQATILKTYTNKVLICYDGDSAGKAAALKALEIFNKLKMITKVVVLPNGNDPLDYFLKEDNLDVIDKYAFNQHLFKTHLLLDELAEYNLSTQFAAASQHALKKAVEILKGASRRTILPAVYLISQSLKVEEEIFMADLVLCDALAFAYSFKILLKDLGISDHDRYLKSIFNQTPDALARDTDEKLKRKEAYAYETMSKLY